MSNFSIKKPEIVVLCGSLKFKRYFHAVNFAETMLGNIVLMPGLSERTYEPSVTLKP